MDANVEEGWHEWRAKGIGASDVPAILGLSPWSGPYAVWASKTGRAGDVEPTEAMMIGHHAELTICSLLEERFGVPVTDRQRRCEHPEHPWMRCTLDGMIDLDGPVIVEAKTTSLAPDDWVGGQFDGVPENYAAQVAWQMLVTGHDRAVVASLHANRGLAFRVHELDIDMLRPLQERAIEEVTKFWYGHVVADVPPPLDGTKGTSEALSAVDAEDDLEVELDDIADVVDRLVALKKRNAALWDEIRTLENVVRQRLGGATVGTIGGAKAVTWRPETRTTVSAAALRTAAPDVFDALAKQNTTRVLRIIRKVDDQWDA